MKTAALAALSCACALLLGCGGSDEGSGGGEGQVGDQTVRGLRTGFADYFFEAGTPPDRASLLDEAQAAGAEIVRLEVSWRGVAPERPERPRDPEDPAYDFAVLDAAVRDAADRGFARLLTLAGAPSWAEGPERPDTDLAPSGSWRPDPAALREFATALARRYSGEFAPEGDDPLPRVRYFEAWNEPNLPTFLTPQWEGEEPVAVETYRAMLNAFYDGVHGAEPDDEVIAGTLAPYGDPPGGPRTRPLAFLRRLLCIEGEPCPEPAKFDVLSHHVVDSSGGPTKSAIDPDDVATPDLHRILDALRTAEREGTLGTGGPHPLWVTELWWESNPPDATHGAPLGVQARRIEQSLHLVWKQGVETALLLQLRDDPYDPVSQPDALQTGVLFENGERKPSFEAFRFPFVTEAAGGGRLLAWLKAPRSGILSIELYEQSGWRSVKSLEVSAGEVYTTLIDSSGGRFRAVVGGDRSLVWHQD